MTKEQAAAALGVSVRSVIRYAQKGLLKVSYVTNANGTGGSKVAIYDQADIEKLRGELEEQRNQPRQPPPSFSREEALALRGSGDMAPVIENFKAGLVEALAEALRPTRGVPIEAQLTLSLQDASMLSGLSRDYLLAAIKADKLRASKDRSRGWNIKRADLNMFIAGL